MRSANKATTVRIPVLEPCTAEKRNGVLYRIELGRGVFTLAERSVREIGQQHLDALIKRRKADELGMWGEHLLTLVKLLAAFQNEDDEYFRRLIQDEPELIEDPHLKQQAVARPQAWVASYFASGLEGARFVVWWDERQKALAPGILCTRQRAIPYALATTFLRRPEGVGICLRCETPFPRKRAQQFWCSSRCRSAEAMARWRQSGKEQGMATKIQSRMKTKTSRSSER